jgi:hypothetical protein
MAFIIRVERVSELGDTFLQNVGPYKNHTESHPRRRHSTYFLFLICEGSGPGNGLIPYEGLPTVQNTAVP